MSKRVELSPTAYKWMLRHRFISEEALIGIVLHCPLEERKYIGKNKFQVLFKKRKNKKFVEIMLWVEERQEIFCIQKIHSTRV
ncbi:hypothetical protein KEJ15_02830 [Candidatus Bathyarchaeota archaeon]|nr:hypothetical protein [Candidatus Bathyarchaeota archaeon]